MEISDKRLQNLIADTLAIESEEAKKAGALGFMARALVQATMPHKKTAGNEFVRRNGVFSLSILAPSSIGLPYGSIPRLLMAWLTTEAVVTKNRTISLGNTLSAFMSRLDLVPTGGRWGSISRVKTQARRLFSASISCSYNSPESEGESGFRIADSHELWWFPKSPEQSTLFESTVTLSEGFFKEITTYPVPVDMRALNALKRSPMALDTYCWLSYKMSYLSKNTEIPWGVLALQFGADYTRVRDFKRYFVEQLGLVHGIYPGAKFEVSEKGLILKPGKPHIPKSTSKSTPPPPIKCE